MRRETPPMTFLPLRVTFAWGGGGKKVGGQGSRSPRMLRTQVAFPRVHLCKIYRRQVVQGAPEVTILRFPSVVRVIVWYSR